MLQGVYTAARKDGTIYYRSNITYKSKHISLGSFDSELSASRAYATASTILLKETNSIEDSYFHTHALAFDKIVTLINYRDNGMYIKTPIYLRKNYFSYYLDISHELKFDIDDLFYYSEHRILKRQGHLYVNDYGMQVTLLSRYGIQPHAVCGRDYVFVNNDPTDMRYENIKLLNPYHGVEIVKTAGLDKYKARIHINGLLPYTPSSSLHQHPRNWHYWHCAGTHCRGRCCSRYDNTYLIPRHGCIQQNASGQWGSAGYCS